MKRIVKNKEEIIFSPSEVAFALEKTYGVKVSGNSRFWMESKRSCDASRHPAGDFIISNEYNDEHEADIVALHERMK